MFPRGSRKRGKTMATETQTEKIMRLLKCTKEEAEDVIATDKMIDRGERSPYDLDPEKEKEIIKAFVNTKTKKAPTVYKFDKRERKPNATKGSIISELAKFLENDSENAVSNLNITNAERVIAFSIGDDNFELTLTQKRKPKA
jgi:hypothetical protein